MSILHVPKLSLVILMGATGSGKSSFARKHFKPTEIVSSDVYRGLVSDDETSLEASADAFELLYHHRAHPPASRVAHGDRRDARA